MKERKPYPFFYSVEFLTVLFKVATTSLPLIPILFATGFKAESFFALLTSVIQGLMLAAKELEIHQNLYIKEDIPLLPTRSKEQAIQNIALTQAKAIAQIEPNKTVESVLQEVATDQLVDLAVGKPSLGKAARTLARNFIKDLPFNRYGSL